MKQKKEAKASFFKKSKFIYKKNAKPTFTPNAPVFTLLLLFFCFLN